MPEGPAAPDPPLRLNHVEFAHRPGEGALVKALVGGLGCGWYEVDVPPYGGYIVIRLDDAPHGVNDMFASVAEPEQLALEHALELSLAGDEGLASAAGDYRALQRHKAFRASHIGLRLPSVARLDDAVARLTELAQGRLAGRLALGEATLRSREESSATSTPIKQLWLWTDVISTGLLTFGQQIELQAYEP